MSPLLADFVAKLCCVANAQLSNPRSGHIEFDIARFGASLNQIARWGLKNSFATKSARSGGKQYALECRLLGNNLTHVAGVGGLTANVSVKKLTQDTWVSDPPSAGLTARALRLQLLPPSFYADRGFIRAVPRRSHLDRKLRAIGAGEAFQTEYR
jgi:hypothetical protein